MSDLPEHLRDPMKVLDRGRQIEESGGLRLEQPSSKTEVCPHPTLYARDMFNQPQPWGDCLLCERDTWKREAVQLGQRIAELEHELAIWRQCHRAPGAPTPPSDALPAEGAVAAYDACVDIYRELSPQGLAFKGSRFIRFAWEVGRQIFEARAAVTKPVPRFTPGGEGLNYAWCKLCGLHRQKHVAPNESCPPRVVDGLARLLLEPESTDPIEVLPDGTCTPVETFDAQMDTSDTSPVTQQEIVSAIHQHAKAIARLSEIWPAPSEKPSL